MLLSPLYGAVKVAAHVHGIEVRPRLLTHRYPVVRDNTHVHIASQLLAQHLDAMS